MARLTPLAVACSLALACALLPAASASGRTVDSGALDGTFYVPQDNYCGVPGLSVVYTGTVTGNFRVKAEGRAGLLHYQQHVVEKGTITVLNDGLPTGAAVTYREVTNAKDLKVTDNGNGTLTIVAFSTGAFTVYDANGRPISRNPGQHRERIVVDDNGTPDDPDDDSFVSSQILKQSTGRSDDFCGPVLAALGGDTAG